MIGHMDTVFISIQTGPSMKVIGSKTNNMDGGKKPGRMVLFTKESTKKERKRVRENSFGVMEQHMKEISVITTFMVLFFK